MKYICFFLSHRAGYVSTLRAVSSAGALRDFHWMPRERSVPTTDESRATKTQDKVSAQGQSRDSTKEIR